MSPRREASGRLAAKIAIITGAGAGIGRAAALLFAAEGASVVAVDCDAERVRDVAEAIGEAALAVVTDVACAAEVENMVETATARHGRIDVLVNNAGFGLRGSVVTTSEADWDDLMAVNLKGVFLCSKYVIPVMAAGGGGAIVNTASVVSNVGIPDRAAYVASKGGVAALTRAMALDHAKDGIRVNCVAPGSVASSYFDQMLATVPDPEAFRRALEARSPMHRVADPAEIASAILWLASDEASFATGSTLTVDGGMTAW